MTADSRLPGSPPGEPDTLEGRIGELEWLYRVTPVGICVNDRDLRYLRVNQEYADIVGHRIEDIVGRTIREVVHPQARESVVAKCGESRAGAGLIQKRIETGVAQDRPTPLENVRGSFRIKLPTAILRQAQEAVLEAGY